MDYNTVYIEVERGVSRVVGEHVASGILDGRGKSIVLLLDSSHCRTLKVDVAPSEVDGVKWTFRKVLVLWELASSLERDIASVAVGSLVSGCFPWEARPWSDEVRVSSRVVLDAFSMLESSVVSSVSEVGGWKSAGEWVPHVASN